MNGFNAAFWEEKYELNKTGWDVGYATKPITHFIDGLKNKEIKILIPGAGNGYEAEYIFNKGFKNIYLLDFAGKAIERFKKRVPCFPEENILQVDFFNHKGKYDLIVEQTFFSSIKRQNREEYAMKMFDLLKPDGKFIGLLFNHEFGNEWPPFGGTKEEYLKLFSRFFTIKKLDIAYNSIKPRLGRELFFVFMPKKNRFDSYSG